MNQAKILFKFQGDKNLIEVSSKDDICKLINNREFYFPEEIKPDDIEFNSDFYNKSYVVVVKGNGIGYINQPIS